MVYVVQLESICHGTLTLLSLFLQLDVPARLLCMLKERFCFEHINKFRRDNTIYEYAWVIMILLDNIQQLQSNHRDVCILIERQCNLSLNLTQSDIDYHTGIDLPKVWTAHVTRLDLDEVKP